MHRSRQCLAAAAASRAWLEVQIRGGATRRIDVDLFASKCPMACENFAKLCSGDNVLPFTAAKDTIQETTFKDQFRPQLSYVRSTFHRVVPGFVVQGGDIVKGNGEGNMSVFGEEFDAPAERGAVPLDAAGLIATAVSAPTQNGSQFFITLSEKGAPHLNGSCICFGRVAKASMDVIKEIERQEVDFEGRPLEDIVIVAAGSK